MDVAEFVAELGAAGVTLFEEDGRLRYRAPKGVLTPDRLETLRARREDVLGALREREYGPGLTIEPGDAHEPFPLTDVQEAYLLGRSRAFAYGGVACHGYLELALPQWEPDLFEDGWNTLIRRHPMLRAVVSPEGHQRVLAEVPRYRLRRTDLREATEAEAAGSLEAIRAEMSHQVRPTDQWPLFEVRATRTGRGVLLHLAVDLLICDYSSIRLLLGELNDLCTGAAGAEPPELTFRDYALAVRGVREGTRYQRDREYWWNRIDDLPPAPALPVRTDAPDAPPRFIRHGLRLSPERWRAFGRYAGEAGVSASGALLQVFAETIGRWSRTPRFTVSLTLENRLPLHPAVSGVVGDFSSTSLLAVDLAEGGTLRERTTVVQTRLWEDLDHRLCSGVEVLRELARRRGRAEALLPVTFTSTVSGAGAGAAVPARLMPDGELVGGITQTPQVWIDCQIMEDGGGLLAHWDVREGIFPDGLVQDMFTGFADLIRLLAEEPGAWSAEDPLVLPRRQRDSLAAVNATVVPRSAGLLHEEILAQAERTPDRVAVVCSGRTLSYAELIGRARAVAVALTGHGCEPGERVGIVMDKGWEQVVAVLGTLLAGGVYLPVDTTQPPLRRNTVLLDAGARHVLTQSALLSTVEPPAGVTVLAVDELAPVAGQRPPHRTPGDLAYVIYTSGSTGTPKGVMISHAAARNTVDDINTRFSVTERDSVLGLAQLGFDLSVYDIFGPLAVGGRIVLPDADQRGNPAHWAELVTRHEITLWNSVPAQMQMLEEFLRSGPELEDCRLRLAMLSGDWLPVTLPDAIRHRIPGLEVISLGGATEAAIWSIYHPVGVVDPALGSIPYGRPLANQSFHVLDTRMRECPEHVVGELHIGGAGLAEGYLGDAERTAERFVRHPVTGARLYRTGDLGRRLAGGEIEFLGRVDRQVKLNGHRVELAEVEAAVQTYPRVRAAAATVCGQASTRKLVAFAEPDRVSAPQLPVVLRERAAAAGLAAVHGVDDAEVTEMTGLLEVAALHAMTGLFRACGLFADGAGHTAEEIIETVKAARENHYLVRRWLAVLEREGKIVREPDAGRYHGLVPVDAAEQVAVRRRMDELEPRTRWGAEVIRYLRASNENLGPLVRNEIDLKTLLFPEGRLDTAEAAYRDNLISRHNNAVVVAALREIAGQHRGPGPLRLLEIGAGVGGTSTVLVPELDGFDVEYLFTDLSHFFLSAAQEQFQEYPWVHYGLFDLNQDYREQGRAPNSFDVILLANVLHNSVHAGEVLARLRELLAPGGWLVFIEATRDAYHVMTSMEFNAGLTGFTDQRQETGRTFFDREQWLEMLGEAGAEVAFCLPAEDSALGGIGQHVFAARLKADRAPVHQQALLDHLAQRLPGYMIPAELQVVDRIPLTGNGKVDRARLDAWAGSAESGRTDRGDEPPRDGMEQALARLWTEVLPVPSVGRNGNFFELGGDSLLVARLVTTMRDELAEAAALDWDDLLRLVMNRPTVAELAARLDPVARQAPGGEPTGTALVRISAAPPGSADQVPRVLVHDGTGTLIPYRTLIRELSPRLCVAGLVIDDTATFLSADPRDQVAELADRHARTLLDAGLRQVHLIGYCMGGLLAPELAARLIAAGAEVTGLTIISSYRVPYLVEDDLLAEYIFAKLMRADPVALGYPRDESGTRELIQAATRRYGDTVPQGSLDEQRADALTEAGARALCDFQELARRPQRERLAAIGAGMTVEDAELRSADRLFRQLQIVKHSLVAVATHVPTPYTRPATFVRQTGDAEIFPGMMHDMTHYWRQVCVGGLSIVDIPGDHFDCLQAPNSEFAARALLPEGGW